tara:strand:- start:743 stop:2104 length:1362 start_codon:yes stop_codon:yes gene_type:complete
MKNSLIIFIFSTITFFSCKQTIDCDLVITNANILNVETGNILKNKSIIINKGKIENIISNFKNYKAIQNIDAKGKLVTPSFIDTHIHPTDVFGDRDKAPKRLDKNARKKLSEAYLPYGTTTTLMLGQPENWLSTILNWQKESNPQYTDHYTSGGAMISKEDREPYIGHCVLENSQKAKEKVIEYYNLGIRHIKLYYRLNNPEFEIAYKTADSLNMNVYGHIGGFGLEHLKIKETLKLGLTKYEHLGIIPNNILTNQDDWDKLDKQFAEHFGEMDSESRVLEYLLEQFRYLDEYKKNELNNFINFLAENDVSFSTTIHYLYQQFESTYFSEPSDKNLTIKQKKRCLENFEIMMKYAKQMHNAGIQIRLGSDMPNGGKANISELILMCKYGFPVADVMKIASLNGANAIGIENEVGSLKIGKKANLIIWRESPFDNLENFTSEKTIIKDGKVIKK